MHVPMRAERAMHSMTKRNNIIAGLLLVLLGTVTVFAENGMNSPYTRFGIGQLNVPQLGASRAMGGTGIGMRSVNQINMLNPASYSTVDTLTFILDMGCSLQNTNFSENDVRRNARNATFDHLAVQYRLRPHLGMTMAYLPYSSVGYSYQTKESLFTDEDGTVTTTNKYEGEGGLQQIAVGLGWRPFKWLAVGGNVNYFYGYLQHKVENQYNVSTIDSRTKIYSAEFNAIGYDLGAQLAFSNKKNRFIAGVTYSPSTSLGKRKPYAIDYVISNNIAASSDTLPYGHLSRPESYGAGFSYAGEHITVAADASLKRFGSALFFGQSGLDSYRASLGVEYRPTYNGHHFFKSMAYRAGAYYSSTYFNIDGTPGPDEFGASVGVAIPIINGWNQRSTVSISGQYIHAQQAAKGMIAENYLRLNVGITFIEDWFTKWRVN